MLLLRGPTKIDLIFPGEKRRWSPAWAPSPETLEAIDRHFWDWILWLEQKRRGGRRSQLEKSLRDLFELMLGPMGVVGQPRSSTDAVDSYLAARSELELQFGTRVLGSSKRRCAPSSCASRFGTSRAVEWILTHP